MKIALLQNGDKEKYGKLSRQYGTVFNDSRWLSMYGSALELLGIYEDDNQLIGAFYLYKTKQARLRFYRTPPFSPSVSLFFNNKAKGKANRLRYEKKIMELMAAYLDSQPFQILSIAMPFSCIDMQPFIWKKYKVIPNYTYHLNLQLSPQELLEHMATDKRNYLKKAEKDKITIRQTTDYAAVKQFVSGTYSRKEKQLNEVILDKILFDFSDAGNSFAFVASLEEKPIATAFCIHDQTTAYYLLGGYDQHSKHSAAGVSVLWASIQHAQSMNLHTFDFEGSMLPEVEAFFRGFGPTLIPYYTINKAQLPVEMLLKLVKREIF